MRKQAATILLALGVCLTAALGGLFAAGVVGVPDGGLEDNAWGEVGDERIEVLTTVWIDNPNSGVSLDNATVEYAIAMNDVGLAEGSADNVSVQPGNTSTELRTDLRYQQLPAWWASHVDNDEVSDLEVDLTAHTELGPLSGSPSHTHEDEIETDLEPMIEDALAEQEGEHSLSPVESGSGTATELVEPTVEIRDTDAQWGEVTESETELHLSYEIHNPNAHPLPTPAMTGEMAFNEYVVADWDAHDVDLENGASATMIPPGESREITFVVVTDNDDVAEWFATHVDNEEYSDVAFRAQLAMTIDGETVTIPGDEEAIHCEYEMQTSIFVDQESGMTPGSCELLPWATPDDGDLERFGAAIDLSEIPWSERTETDAGSDGDTTGTDRDFVGIDGEYDPESPEGQHILAHEPRVRQQNGADVSMMPQEDAGLEIENDQLA